MRARTQRGTAGGLAWALVFGAWAASAGAAVTGWAGDDQGKPDPPPNGDRLVTIDAGRTLTLNGPFRGYGVQDDTHMMWDSYNNNTGVVLPDDFDNAVWPQLAAMRLPFVRKFIRVSEFAPAEGVYTWDTPAMQGLYVTLKAHQAAGTDVMLTFWRLPPWLAPSPYTFPSQENEERFAIVVTDLVAHLRGLDRSGLGLANVKYLGFPNELEGIWAVAPLTHPYEVLRKHLGSRGLQDVQLFGPDMYSVGSSTTAAQAIQAARNIPQLDATLAFYDWHSYTQAPDFSSEGPMVYQMSRVRAALAGSGRQVWNTEFGNFATQNNQWQLTPLFAIHAANYGNAAAVAWNFMDMTYGESQPAEGWGLIRSQFGQYRPKLAYFAYSLITSRAAAGSKVLDNSCAELQCPSLRVAAFELPGGAPAVLAYNLHATERLNVRFQYTGPAPPDQLLERHLMDPATDLEARSDPVDSSVAIPLADGAFSDTIPPRAFAVYAPWRGP